MVRVERYKGDAELQRGLQQMLAEGWQVQNQSSRKQVWAATTGVFTKHKIHTVTYVWGAPGRIPGAPPRPDL